MERMLYRPTEAAELLGISRSRVYELMNQGAIASVSIGRCRRISSDSLATFLESISNTAGDVDELY